MKKFSILLTILVVLLISSCSHDVAKTCNISFPEPPVTILDAEQAGKQHIGYFNIVQTGEREYRMYYTALGKGAAAEESGNNLYIACSDDLVHWKTERPGGGSDLIMKNVTDQYVCRIEGDEYPYRLIGNVYEDDRYKMCMWFSKDGLEFTDRTVVMDNGKHDSQSVVIPRNGHLTLYFLNTEKTGTDLRCCDLSMDGKMLSKPCRAAGKDFCSSAAVKLDEESDLLLPVYKKNARGMGATCCVKAYVQTGKACREVACPLNDWFSGDEKWVLAAPGAVTLYGRSYIACNVGKTSPAEGQTGRSEYKLIEISIDRCTSPALAAGARKRLVAMDLDATLTQHKTALSDTNRMALDALAERYHLLMVGGGGAERIHNQMLGYPIDILGNYGMQEARVTEDGWKIVRTDITPVDTADVLAKCRALREKYGYTEYFGDPVEFHSTGMITFGLLGTRAPSAAKLTFDPDKMKRRAMYKDVCRVFGDYSVFIGGSTSFDLAAKKYNKYDAVMRYAEENGYARDEIIFIGDDLDDGGNDSHVRLGGMDYIRIYDYRKFPEMIAPLLK